MFLSSRFVYTMAVIVKIFAILLVSTAVLAYPNPNTVDENTTELIDVVQGNDNNDDDFDSDQDFPVDSFESFEDNIPVGDFLSPANQNLDSNDEILEEDLNRNKRHGGYGIYVVYPSYGGNLI